MVRRLLQVLALLVPAVVAVAPAQAAPAARGALAQLASPAGCVREAGGLGCAAGVGLDGARGVAVSPDGKHVYVVSTASDTLDVFSRDPATGALAQLALPVGCFKNGGGGGCAAAAGLDGPVAVTISPDGRNVYVASGVSNAIALFLRDPNTGGLAQLAAPQACIRDGGGAGCANGNALSDPLSIAVAPDGGSVYVASQLSDSIAAFGRDPATGALTQLGGFFGCVRNGGGDGCAVGNGLDGVNGVTVTPDGRHVIATAAVSDAVLTFARGATGGLTQLAGGSGCIRNTGGGGCANGRQLDGPSGVAVSRDGLNVYVTSAASNSVGAFRRDAATGALAQLAGIAGCVRNAGGGGCTTANALAGPRSPVLSPDDGTLYVTATGSDAITAFARDATGGLTQLAGTAACVRNGAAGVCSAGVGLDGAQGAAVSPDGKSAYVASGVSDAVAVLVRQAAPVCVAAEARTAVNGPTRVTLGCADPNGDPISRLIVTQPSHGKLGAVDQATGQAWYTPTNGFKGTDTFTFKASDGSAESAPVTVTIVVTRFETGPLVTLAPGVVTLRNRAVIRLRISCPSLAVGGCKGVLTLRPVARPGLVIARRNTTIGRGKKVFVNVTLNKPGRAYVQSRSSVNVRVVQVTRDKYNNTRKAVRVIKVLVPKA